MGTPVSLGNQMSEGLKARLKRCGRSYSSPGPAKRQCTSAVNSPSLTTTNTCSNEQNSENRLSDQQKENLGQTPNTTKTSLTGSNNCKKTSHGSRRLEQTFKCPAAVAITSDQQCTNLSKEPTRQLKKDRSIPDDEFLQGFERNKQDREKVKPSASLKKSQDSCSVDNVAQAARDSEEPKKGISSLGAEGTNKDGQCLRDQRSRLLAEVAAKEEKLRKLKMVKMYRSKNNLCELATLIAKWRSISQDSILRLHGLAQEPKPTLRQLVAHLQIEPHMVGFDPEDESFT